jgi:hypothetical protein
VDLENLYRQQIAGRGKIYNANVAASPIAIKQRDPKSIEMESALTKSMHEALQKVVPQHKPIKQVAGLRVVSPEEAEKELADLLKLSDNKL